MPGIDNSVLFADNIDFSGNFPVSGEINLNGELLVGANIAPFIRPYVPTGSNGLVVNTGQGTIDFNLANIPNSALQHSSVTVTAGAGLSGGGTVSLGGTITIALTGAGFNWNVVTSANNTVQIVVENGYIAKGAGQVVFLLPAAAAIGDTFTILGYGNLWQLTQNAGQTVFFGSQSTTGGVGGSLTATMIKDRIEVICVTANTEFEVVTSIGNLTVV